MGKVKPTSADGWYKLQYLDLPENNATDFTPQNDAANYKPPIIEFGSPKRLRVFLLDRTSDLKQYAIPQSARFWSLADGVATVAGFNAAVFPVENMETHIGVFAFDKELSPVLSYRQIPANAGKAEISALLNAITSGYAQAIRSKTLGKDRHLYSCLDTILSEQGDYSLLKYMKEQDIILADIFVITPGLDTSNDNQKMQAIIDKCRDLFIPVNVHMLWAQTGDDLARLSQLTGGESSQKATVPLLTGGETKGGYYTPLVPYQFTGYDYDTREFLQMQGKYFPMPSSGTARILAYEENQHINWRDPAQVTGRMARTGSSGEGAEEIGGLAEEERPEADETPMKGAVYYPETRGADDPAQEARPGGIRTRAAYPDHANVTLKFPVDRSLKQVNFQLVVVDRAGVSLTDFKVTAPNGVTYTPDMIQYQHDFAWIDQYFYYYAFKIDNPQKGQWTVKFNNNSVSKYYPAGHVLTYDYIVTGHAENIDALLEHRVHVEGAQGQVFNRAENGGKAIVTATATRGGANYTGVSMYTTVRKPSGGAVFTAMRDDGAYPDVMANDGIYTGTVDCPEEGMYFIESTADNRSGKARGNLLYSYRGDWELDDESPFWGEQIDENFNRIFYDSFIVADVPAVARRQAPPFEPLFRADVGKKIVGPYQIIPGIPAEYTVEYSASSAAFDDYLKWETLSTEPLDWELTPVPGKGPNTVRLLLKKAPASVSQPRIQVSFRVPRALEGLLTAKTLTERLSVGYPAFDSDVFWMDNKTLFVGEELRCEGQLWIPDDYDARINWRKGGLDSVAEVVSRDNDAGIMVVRAKAPGTFTLQLASTPYPDVASETATFRVIQKESPGGPLPPNPDDGDGSGPGAGPGTGENHDGDDDVRTDPDDDGEKPRSDDEGEIPGGGGNPGETPGGGDGPGEEPELPDPDDEPDLLPPGLLKISIDGNRVSDADLFVLQPAHFLFEFSSAVERHSLAVALDGEGAGAKEADSSFAEISGETLGQGGLTFAAEFVSRVEGTHRVHYSFEGRNGFAVSGDFTMFVRAGDGGGTGPGSETDDGRNGDGGGGGGCNGGPLAFLLLAAAALLPFAKNAKNAKNRAAGKRALLIALAAIPVLFAAGASADTYVVTDPGDDALHPAPGTIRSILITIDRLGTRGDTIQFAPGVDEIELKAPLQSDAEVAFDAYTGRSGRRVRFTLAQGGYRHFEIQGVFSFNGIVLRGFGDDPARNVADGVNGGLHHKLGSDAYTRSTIENCTFEQIWGQRSPVLIEGGSFYFERNARNASAQDECLIEMKNCVLQNNFSAETGGALFMTGQVLIRDSFLAYNHADGAGGACVSWMDPATVPPSVHNTLVGNRLAAASRGAAATARIATRQNGGVAPASAYDGPPQILILSHCTLLNNRTPWDGGAVYAGELILCNTTMYGNSAATESPAVYAGEEGLSYRASLFAANDPDVGNPNPPDPLPDEHGNLFANGASDDFLEAVFESLPPLPEPLGGYVPVIPLRYAGPAEGCVPGDVMSALADYPADFARDARGVSRDYAAGASAGAFGFGSVALEPGNVQNSTVIVLPPNDAGSIKVRLAERVRADSFSYVNYLGDVSVDFTLAQGDTVEGLPGTARTQDNGRAFVAVETKGEGENIVHAALPARPDKSLDLKIVVSERKGGGSDEEPAPIVPDDMYVVLLTPGRTTPDVENSFDVLFSRACASGTVSVRRKGTAEYLERGIPVTMTGPDTGILGKQIAFAKRGTYMFDFAMTDPEGRQYDDIKPVKVEDVTSLKVFRLSAPPYFEDRTFSMTATFSRAPWELVMRVRDEAGNVYRPEVRNANERCDWEGLITLGSPGQYTAELEYTDSGDGRTYSERFTIYVSSYYGGEGDVTVNSSYRRKGGCAAGTFPPFALCPLLPLLWRRRR